MAACSCSGRVTRVMPMLEPARAGLTNTGQPSEATASIAAAGSCCHWRSLMTTNGPDRQAVPGEDQLHVVLVHHHRGGEHARPDVADVRQLEHALQGAVLAERPVQQREHDVDLAELARRLARLEDRQRPVGGAERHEHAGAVAVDLGHVARAQLQRRRLVGDEHPAAVLGDADGHAPRRRRGRSRAARRPRWRRRRRAPRSGRRRRGRRGDGARRGRALGYGACQGCSSDATLSPAIRSPVQAFRAAPSLCAWTTCTPRPSLPPRSCVSAGRQPRVPGSRRERPAGALLDVRRRRPGRTTPAPATPRGRRSRRRSGRWRAAPHWSSPRAWRPSPRPCRWPPRAASSWHRRTPTTAPA